MKFVSYLLALLLLPLMMAACTGEESGGGPGTTQGPALIMFYTDN